MNWRDISVVFTTELKNTLRDRRTWFAMILVPLLLMPVLLLVAPTALENQRKQMEETPPPIAIVGAEHASTLVTFLRQAEGLTIVESSSPAAELENGDLKAVVYIGPGLEAKIAAGNTGNIRIDYDASDQESEIARSRLQQLIGAYTQQIVAERLAARGLDVSILAPLNTEIRNVAPQEKVGAFFLSLIMPMMLAVWAALGGMYAAIDAVAGEKERGTLEPLLATPPTRLSLVIGKYLTVVFTSVVAAAIAMVGMYVSFLIKPEVLMGEGAAAGLRFHIPVVNALLMLGIAVLLAGLFSALEIALSAFARSFREAQTYLSPFTIVVVLPGILTQFVDPANVNNSLFCMPLLNGILVFKEILMNEIDWSHVTTTVISSVLWIALAIRLTVSIFKRESVLFRT